MNITHDHRYKIPEQNIQKLNPKMYKNSSTP